MIVALTGEDGDSAVADLAEDLAMLRVAAGKRVLLVAPSRTANNGCWPTLAGRCKKPRSRGFLTRAARRLPRAQRLLRTLC
jgi:hypothetical protein